MDRLRTDAVKEPKKGLEAYGLEPLVLSGGASRNRTDDLYNAIVALSQLSYDPEEMGRASVPAILAQIAGPAGAGK